MMLLRALAASLLISCTVNKYYVAPPPPAQPAPGPAPAGYAQTPPDPGPGPTPEPGFVDAPPSAPVPMPVAEQPSDLERRFAVAKAFLLANKSVYTFGGSHFSRVGYAGEQAPILEAPGGGFLIVADRRVRDLVEHPVVVRLDAAGNVVWTLELPRPKKFDTFEVDGGVLAPDGTLVVEVVPYKGMGANPQAAMISKVALNGTLVWSMQLSAGGGVMGPHPQRLVVAPDGTIALFGHATYEREAARAPGTGDWTRTWKGLVSGSGSQIESTIGGMFHDDRSDTFRPPWRQLDPYWCDLDRCF